MRRPWNIFFWLVASCATEASPPERCLEPSTQEGPAVATVGHVPLSEARVLARIDALGHGALARYREPAMMRAFIEDQLRVELLAQAALDRGYARDAEVVDAARVLMAKRLLERDLANVLGEDGKKLASEEAVQRYYEKHRDDFVQPELRRIAHVQFPPTTEGEKRAAALIAELDLQADVRAVFRRRAKELSSSVSDRDTGGERRFETRDELAEALGPEVAAAAFALDEGALARAPIRGMRGWHVVRLGAVREAIVRKLEDVRERIVAKLLENRRTESLDAYLAELRLRYPVTLYEERVARLAQRVADRIDGEATR